MSDKIYIWEERNGNVGHGSMTLHDGTHISWWPAVLKNKTTAKKHMTPVKAWASPSYDKDAELEGHGADFMIPITRGKLNIDAIKAWWMQFRRTGTYHVLVNNCCSVVYEALKQGGATKYVPFPTFLLNPISKPANLMDYALKLKQATDDSNWLQCILF